MASSLLMLLALVVVIAAAWAALVTLFLPPLTLGWREFYEAMIRRWVRNVVVRGRDRPRIRAVAAFPGASLRFVRIVAILGVGAVLVFVLWHLFVAVRCGVSSRS